MRADRIGPSTWLLGAAAAWAVLGLVLAWAGMGGRVAAADAGDAGAPALPRPAADTKAPAQATWDAFAARPPFAQDRRPHPFVLPGGGDGARVDAATFDYALTSVVITPRLRMAIIEPASGGESLRVRAGESADGLDGWRLLEVHPRAAVFEGPGGRRVLPLRVWAGGEGGAAATATPPMDAPPPAPAGDAQPARPMSPQGDSPVPEAVAPDAPGAGQQRMEAIRRRIQARRAQLPRTPSQSQASPAPDP